MNVKRCNERKTYEVLIKYKEHELEATMKYDNIESMKALRNHILIEEAKILDERQGKEAVQRERMFWAENIA